MTRSPTPIAANDDEPHTRIPGQRRRKNEITLQLTPMAQANTLGFFKTLDRWMKAANDNEPSKPSDTLTHEVSDDR